MVLICLFSYSSRLHPSLTGRTLASRCCQRWDGKKVAGLELLEGWKHRWWQSSKQQSQASVRTEAKCTSTVDDVTVVALSPYSAIYLTVKLYGMASFERFVNSSTLNVVVPNVVLDFPTQDIDHSAWLSKLRSDEVERERAFFGISCTVSFFLFLLIHWLSFLDECLDFFFILCLEQLDEASVDPAHPPSALLAFLAHTQVSYDATYISSASVPSPSGLRSSAPPRTASLKPNADTGGLHVPPSIFPPNTPHPTPVTTEQDRRYVRAEGVTLVSRMWGEEIDPTKARQVSDRDAFALLWDETACVWVAVYRMCINVGTLWTRLKSSTFPAPLILCLWQHSCRFPCGTHCFVSQHRSL
jgi:hypothetical protein